MAKNGRKRKITVIEPNQSENNAQTNDYNKQFNEASVNPFSGGRRREKTPWLKDIFGFIWDFLCDHAIAVILVIIIGAASCLILPNWLFWKKTVDGVTYKYSLAEKAYVVSSFDNSSETVNILAKVGNKNIKKIV